MTGRRLIQVDAFTDRAFGGNPAAVCLLDEMAGEAWMQSVAAEMNLSETAFVAPSGVGFDLRWFTPTVEVDLCGHATLASAHVLWEERLADGAIHFHTRSGDLVCERQDRDIWMDFPARPVEEAEPPRELLGALGVEPVSAGTSAVGWLLELGSEQEVRAATPDFARMLEVPESWTCITAVADQEGFDFVSRYFAPQAGIDEDPVTGSAHCALADHWGRRLGRDELVGFQTSRRGGVVRVRTSGDRVHLGGRAVTVLRGELDAG